MWDAAAFAVDVKAKLAFWIFGGEIDFARRRVQPFRYHDEVAEGMSKKQVESILGPPTELDNKDFVIMKKTTYIYRQGKDAVTIVFKDDKVTEKQSTLTD